MGGRHAATDWKGKAWNPFATLRPCDSALNGFRFLTQGRKDGKAQRFLKN